MYDTLHKVSHLFQLWTCKQVMNIAETNLIQSRYKPHHDPTCYSSYQCVDMCAHVLSCTETGRVDALYQSINLLEKWLKKVGTHTQLRKYILQYAKGRGATSMTDVLHGTVMRYRKLVLSRDLIGCRRFMVGVISKEMLVIQKDYMDLRRALGTPITPISWAKGLIFCLIENTHGQWLYRNLHVHDTVTGFQ